jgi:membrane protein
VRLSLIYTIFSLAPALLIIMSLLGFFFGREAIEGEIYSQIDDLVSHEAALQIQEMIKNIHLSNENVFATSLGLLCC